MHPFLGLFLKITGVVALAIVLLILAAIVLKIVIVAAVIAAVIFAGVFIYSLVRRRSSLPVIR
jgi:hypothetical protein